MILKPFTTETQRHRESQKQKTMTFLGKRIHEYFLPKLNWFALKVVSVSLCLCGEYVFGGKS
jgi:hypothetical protein